MVQPDIQLALDHLTVIDQNPFGLLEVAHAVGCQAICMFLQPMDVLPELPFFDLFKSPDTRKRLREKMADLGVGIDIAYPFTLSRRSMMEDFQPGLETAAELGARYVNVLLYDRDPARRLDGLGEFADLAERHGLGIVVEFFPASQVPSLADGVELVSSLDRPGRVGLNVDLLHLVRSGSSMAALADVPRGYLLYAQLCDGMIALPAEEWGHEASSERLLPGEGEFDLRAFVSALPEECRLSVELPRISALNAGISAEERVRVAVERVLAALRS